MIRGGFGVFLKSCKTTGVISLKMLLYLRSFFKKTNHINSTKIQTNQDTGNARYRKWWMKMLILVFLTTSCFYGFKPAKNVPKPMKHILIWTPEDWYPFTFWKLGQTSFINKKCQFTNCFLSNRNNLFVELSKFDAVAFNGRNLDINGVFDVPSIRLPHQKYIYFNTESPYNSPLCHPIYDGFFNWTATYRLNSDILYPYISIRNSNNVEIGPREHINWLNKTSEVNVANLNKTKAVAWLVSNCVTRIHREDYARNLAKALKKHKLDLDIYGNCGPMKCSKTDGCDDILSNYYFYLSFENSFAEDYVTEKVLTALRNSNVPIVFGGADYSRFLPPRSYLDARQHSPQALAATIARLIKTPEEYKQFFRWRNHYRYQKSNNICRLCAALNNDKLVKKNQVYRDLRRWWNPDYKSQCRNL